jgi:hypothetical protein
VAQGVGPEFKPQCHKTKQNKTKINVESLHEVRGSLVSGRAGHLFLVLSVEPRACACSISALPLICIHSLIGDF